MTTNVFLDILLSLSAQVAAMGYLISADGRREEGRDDGRAEDAPHVADRQCRNQLFSQLRFW